MLSFMVVAFEKSDRYVEVAAVTVVGLPVLVYVYSLFPGVGTTPPCGAVGRRSRIDRTPAHSTPLIPILGERLPEGWGALLFGAHCCLLVVGAITGGEWVAAGPVRGSRRLGWGAAAQLIGVHSFVEGALRPARVAIAGDAGIGDSLPRSWPTFATWSKISMLAVAFGFSIGGRVAGCRVQSGQRISPYSPVDRVCPRNRLRGAD